MAYVEMFSSIHTIVVIPTNKASNPPFCLEILPLETREMILWLRGLVALLGKQNLGSSIYIRQLTNTSDSTSRASNVLFCPP